MKLKSREYRQEITDLPSFDRLVAVVGTSPQPGGEMCVEPEHNTPHCASAIPFHRMRGVARICNEKEQELSKLKLVSKELKLPDAPEYTQQLSQNLSL